MNEMEYETYSTAEYYNGPIKSRPEVVDLEKRMVFMEKQIQQLKHRIAELELRGV
jgi:hypothetical protein